MNTVDARLEAHGGQMFVIIGNDAHGIRLPAPATVGTSWDRRSVVLGIRPECIAESTRRFGSGTAPGIIIPAVVEMTEPTGSETIVAMRLGGEKVLGRVAPDMPLVIGESANFALDTRKLCLFDPKTECLIA